MNSKKPLAKHNLIILLKSLSKYELKKLEEFLFSPYFKCSRAERHLFSTLMQFHPKYEAAVCTDDFLYACIHPGKAFNGGTMRDVISSLTAAIENMLYTELALKDRSKLYMLPRELRMRNLKKLARKKLEESFEVPPGGEEPNYFLHLYMLEAERFNFDMTYGRQLNKKAIQSLGSEIITSTLNLIVFSVTETLSVFANFIIYSERFDENSAKEFLKSTLKNYPAVKLLNIASGDQRFEIIAGIYKKLLKAFSSFGNLTAYKAYREEVMKHAARLSKDEFSFHFARLISSAILGSKYGRDKSAFDIELLELYEITLKNRHYSNSKNPFIPDNLFRSIVMHSLKMNAPELLLKISKEHIDDINPATRNNMRLYASAYYNYIAGFRGKALEDISKLEITMFIFKYDVYNLKMRIFVDESDHVHAWELINTYRQHIKSDSLMPVKRKVIHRNFLIYTGKLLKLMEGHTKLEAGLVIRKLESEQSVMNKEWLMERLRRFDQPVKRYSRVG